MAKRFIDTDLFSDTWFMDLSIEGKILWVYCLTNCDHAGLIEWNKRLIKFQTGIDDLERVTEELGKSLIIVKEHLLFLPKFFEYQYPNYPQKKFPAADSAIKLLMKHDLIDHLNITLTKDFIKSLSNGNGKSNGKKGGAGGIAQKTRMDTEGIDGNKLKPLKKGDPMPDSLRKRISKIGKES